MKKFANKIVLACRLMGKNAGVWLGFSIVAGSVLGLVELGLAIILQLLLRALGISITDVKGFEFLTSLKPTLYELFAILLFTGILRSGLQFVVIQGASIAKENINARLRLVSIYRLLIMNLNVGLSSSDMNYEIGEVYPRTSSFYYFISLILSLCFQSTVLLASMFFTSSYETLFGIGGLVLLGLLTYKINRSIHSYSVKILQEQSELVAGIERVARNWLMVRVLRMAKKEHSKFFHNAIEYGHHSVRAGYLISLSSVIPSLLGIFLLVAIMSMSLLVWHTPGFQVLAFLYLFLRFVQLLSSLSAQFSGMMACMPAFQYSFRQVSLLKSDQLREALAGSSLGSGMSNYARKAKVETLESYDSYSNRPSHPPRIILKNINFSYGSDFAPILTGFNLDVQAGEQIGITGKSGSGKSTLLAIMLGAVQQQSGFVEIDGLSSEEYFEKYSGSVGFVSAEPFLFKGSISQNLGYGCNEKLDDTDLEKALRATHMWTVIQEVRGGLAYQLQENGEGLSAGQKQRLALARALLRKPTLLILDEVSSNLDDDTEALIAETIASLKGKCTVIMVSHRRGMLKFANRVISFPDCDTSPNRSTSIYDQVGAIHVGRSIRAEENDRALIL